MLKVIDSKCLREWWGKERIKLVVKRKEMCLFGSSVSSVAGLGEGCSFFLTAASPQQHPSVYEDRLGLVVQKPKNQKCPLI